MLGKTVVVMVLGELAQSPRMLAHARSLAEAGARLRLVGYAADPAALPLPPAAAGMPAPQLFSLSGAGTTRWGNLPRLAYLPLAALRMALMTLRLRRLLRQAFAGADLVLLQVPPALPALPLALAEARRVGARLVIDWHNLSHAMLALRMGAVHPVVRLLRRAEGYFGRRAAGHMAVTPTLAARLHDLWQLGPVAVLPDRPPRLETPLAGDERQAALARIVAALGGDPALQPGRVMVSPTSWSLDEDMEMILAAVAQLPRQPGEGTLLLIATGRGPRREAFLQQAAQFAGGDFQVLTGWLSEADFRLSLRVADFGLSLHRSASAADFPMKISDMIGAGLPVLALDYGAGLRDGLPPAPAAARFCDAAGLAAGIAHWQQDVALAEARAAALAGRSQEVWNTVWQQQAAPLLLQCLIDEAGE